MSRLVALFMDSAKQSVLSSNVQNIEREREADRERELN